MTWSWRSILGLGEMLHDEALRIFFRCHVGSYHQMVGWPLYLWGFGLWIRATFGIYSLSCSLLAGFPLLWISCDSFLMWWRRVNLGSRSKQQETPFIQENCVSKARDPDVYFFPQSQLSWVEKTGEIKFCLESSQPSFIYLLNYMGGQFPLTGSKYWHHFFFQTKGRICGCNTMEKLMARICNTASIPEIERWHAP